MELGDVWVVAPSRQCSAMSQKLSIHSSLRVEKMDAFTVPVKAAYKVDGTPVDCVKVACGRLPRGDHPHAEQTLAGRLKIHERLAHFFIDVYTTCTDSSLHDFLCHGCFYSPNFPTIWGEVEAFQTTCFCAPTTHIGTWKNSDFPVKTARFSARFRPILSAKSGLAAALPKPWGKQVTLENPRWGKQVAHEN